MLGLLAIIIIAGFFIGRQVRQQSSPRGWVVVDWVCEECDYAFTARDQWRTRDCPRCSGEAVRAFIFYDREANKLVELYRQKPDPDSDMEMMAIEDLMISVPGGEWTRIDSGLEARCGIPVKVDRPQDMIFAPPGSEYR